MKTLLNIKKALMEIAQLLAQNPIINKLLYNDENNALEADIAQHSINEMLNDEYISFYPPVVDSIEDFKRNTFLVVLLTNIDISDVDNNVFSEFLIYATTDLDHIKLTNNRSRILELSDAIMQTLNNVKISSTGIIRVDSIDYVALTEARVGYRISLSVRDQSSGLVEI